MSAKTVMRCGRLILLSVLMLMGYAGELAGQTTIAGQNFDGDTSWSYTCTVAAFDNGWGYDGFLGIINSASADPLDNSSFEGNIFAENDLDDEGEHGTSGFAHIRFQDTNIEEHNQNLETVIITFDYDISGYNASADDIYYEVFYEGAGQGKVYLLDGSADPESREGRERISIPDTVGSAGLVLSLRNNGISGYSGFDNFRIAAVPVKPEPDGHVTGLQAIASGFSKAGVSWEAAKGDTEPDGYIVMAWREEEEFSFPVDGVEIDGDRDWGDGRVTAKVTKDVLGYRFSGLEGGTYYEFAVISFTNSGSHIDYKTDGLIPTAGATTSSPPPVVVTEILADPDMDHGDANGDGVVNISEDEFVELVNTGTEDLDISGWIIEDRTNRRHIFMNPTILKPDQPAVVFGGGYPLGDFGGAYVATASSGRLGLNNSGDEVRIKTPEGTLSQAYGSEGGDNQSLTRPVDAGLLAPLIKHSELEGTTALFSPGTRADGGCYGTAFAILYGEEGWRMIGSPVAGISYKELFSTFWTQGIPDGAQSPNGAANILYHNGIQFRALEDMGAVPEPGTGFIMYVYGDDNYDGYDDYFPKLFFTNASENSGPVAPVLATNSSNSAWTLLANPYAFPINFDLISKNDVSGSIYVYDHFSASYKVWNGITGSLNNGDIAPFQGFWIQQYGEHPWLSIEESDKVETSQNRFYKAAAHPVIELSIQQGTLSDKAYISFSKEGRTGIDQADAFKLHPLDDKSHAALSTAADSFLLSINNLPLSLKEPIELPVVVHISEADTGRVHTDRGNGGGKTELSWDLIYSLPAEWDISLTDSENDHTIDLRAGERYTYSRIASKAKAPGDSLRVPLPQTVSFEPSQRRLILTIQPRPLPFEERPLPREFRLHQNYPNPFNPATSIEFSLPEGVEIKLMVYNITGKTVASLADAYFPAGRHKIKWNAEGLPSGSYICELKTAARRLVNTMTLIK